MKTNKLGIESLKIEIPILDNGDEGVLRGGFSIYGGDQLSPNDINGNCGGNCNCSCYEDKNCSCSSNPTNSCAEYRNGNCNCANCSCSSNTETEETDEELVNINYFC